MGGMRQNEVVKGCKGGSVLRGIAKRQESAMGGMRQNGVVIGQRVHRGKGGERC